MHPDAYRFIHYRADNRHLEARYWNACDGPAPSTALLSDLSTAHRHPLRADPFDPGHIPLIGEMVFIPIEKDLIPAYAADPDVEAFWEALTPSDRARFDDSIDLYRCAHIEALERDSDLGGPVLVRVDQELALERGWKPEESS